MVLRSGRRADRIEDGLRAALRKAQSEERDALDRNLSDEQVAYFADKVHYWARRIAQNQFSKQEA